VNNTENFYLENMNLTKIRARCTTLCDEVCQ